MNFFLIFEKSNHLIVDQQIKVKELFFVIVLFSGQSDVERCVLNKLVHTTILLTHWSYKAINLQPFKKRAMLIK